MSTGRPIEFDTDEVLGAATLTFWSKGYEATSMQDLLAATRLSKSSLYQAFGGKQALFGRCISGYTDQMVGQLRGRLDQSASPLDFIATTLREIAAEGAATAAPRGCLVMNTASEFGQREPEFARWVESGITRVRTVMLLAVKRGQARGEITSNRTAAILADYLMSSIAGLRTMVKAGAPQKMVAGVVDVIVASLQ